MLPCTSICRKVRLSIQLGEMKSWSGSTLKIRIGALRTAVSLMVLLGRKSSIVILVFTTNNLEIIWYYYDASRCKSISAERDFSHICCRSSWCRWNRSLSEWNEKNAGPSREWRPKGAPTTDEVLHVLFETERISIAVFSAVLWRLETKISNKCTEYIAILYSIRVWY